MLKMERREDNDLGDAILRAQQLVRRYVPEGVSLSDELIVERRASAGWPADGKRVETK